MELSGGHAAETKEALAKSEKAAPHDPAIGEVARDSFEPEDRRSGDAKTLNMGL